MSIATIISKDNEFIAKHLKQYCKGKKTISILCLGLLYVEEYLGFWLKQNKEETEVTIHILYDKQLYSRFEKGKGYFNIDVKEKLKWLRGINEKNYIRSFNIDRELNAGQEYDLIINFYLLHNALNWRFSMINFFSCLKKGGMFIFSEIGGSYAILDGNFRNMPAIASNAMLKFEKKRNEDFHSWRPEISLSNYTELKTQIEFLFDKIIDSESAAARAQEWEKGIISKIRINEGFSFQKLVTDQVFSYFNTGIPEESTEELLRAVDDNDFLTKELKEIVERKDQVYICRAFDKKRFMQFRERHWNYNALIKDVGYIKDNKIDILGRKAIDIFTSHDVFFPGYTRFIALVSWDFEHGDFTYPVHFVSEPYADAEKKELPGILKKLLYFDSHTDFDRIEKQFTEALKRFQLYISLVDVSILKKLAREGYTILQKDKIAYCVERSRKNSIKQILIAITPEVSDQIISQNEIPLHNYEKWYVRETGRHSVIPGNLSAENTWLKKDVAIRSAIHKEEEEGETTESAVEPKARLVPYTFTSCNKNELQYLADLFNPAVVTGADKKTDSVATLGWLITLTVLLQLQEKDTRIAFIPSQIIKDESEDRDETEGPGMAGIGGVIFYEKLPPAGNTIFKRLMNARDTALVEAVNLIFYKASIESYVNRDFYKKALQSAVAAITARSGSHTLGSHVLPEVSSKLANLIYSKKGDLVAEIDDIIQEVTGIGNVVSTSKEAQGFISNMRKLEENTRYMSNERELLKYLQERMEYVTQIVGDLPQWTLSMNFIGDLIKNFYSQYHILDCLGDTEGIESYKYTAGKQKMLEKNWFEDKNFETIEIGDQIAVYNHCISLGDSLVFVSDKKNADILKKQEKEFHDPYFNPDFPVIICKLKKKKKKNSEEEEEDPIYEILKKGFDNDFFGQKIKLTGTVDSKDGHKVHLVECKKYDSRLVIKTRIRKYLLLENYSIIGPNDYSKVLSGERKDDFLDIGKKKLKDDLEPKKIGRFKVFLCVIKSIDELGGKDGLKFHRVNLFSSEEIYFEMSDAIYQKINTSFTEFRRSEFAKGSKTKLRRDVLSIGARLILKGVIKGVFNKYQVFGEGGSRYPDISEISFVEYITTASNTEEDRLRPFSDYAVAIPGGIVGAQAFYIILENIIRNAAKHNWVYLPDFYKAGKNLEVKIELEDHNDQEYFICKVWTNTTNLEYKDARPFSKEKLKDFLNDDNNLTKLVKERLISNIIENGKLKRENLGLSEIKIAAAFLARHNWIENGKLSGDDIILKDKEGVNSGGFVRSSMILEEDAGKLVPRFGYRFRLLKPREVLIIGMDGSYNSPELKNAGIQIQERAGQNLDFEFCVLYHNDGDGSFADRIIRLGESVISGHKSAAEINRQINELSCEIETYPCRLFIVSSKNDQTFRHGFKRDELLFFRKRICLLEKREFEKKFDKNAEENQVKTPGTEELNGEKDGQNKFPDTFKNYLYEKWCHMFTRREYNYSLLINLNQGEGESPRSIPLALTVPFNLRNQEQKIDEYDGNAVAEELVKYIYKEENKYTCVFKYHRHDNEKKDIQIKDNQRIIFSDGFSGISKVFSILKDYKRADKKMTSKLVENALTNIMILDERITKYVQSKAANDALDKPHCNLYNICQHLNILLPYEIKLKGEKFYSTSLDIEEIELDGDPCEINISDHKGEPGLSIYFRQPSNTPVDQMPVRHNINSLVIHQTMLDHFARSLYPDNYPGNDNMNSWDRVIFDLKHKANIPCVIITSGRGRSVRASRFAKFMPFSNISDLLLRRDPDKYTLTQILLQSLNLSKE